MVLKHGLGQLTHLILVYPAFSVSYAFKTSHFQDLTFFNNLYIGRDVRGQIILEWVDS